MVEAVLFQGELGSLFLEPPTTAIGGHDTSDRSAAGTPYQWIKIEALGRVVERGSSAKRCAWCLEGQRPLEKRTTSPTVVARVPSPWSRGAGGLSGLPHLYPDSAGWVLDSGAYNMIVPGSQHKDSPLEYAKAMRRYRRAMGHLHWLPSPLSFGGQP
ncbi:hypothetical protein [Actinokineospora diospyrosa]|uniref:hypothetical protein n=1 Tax=Actinokineospora diospyrosa TaxID=103728 RepID=UPI0020A262B5|nr:hypothetical protein [Actinokineospora diospyrosa]